MLLSLFSLVATVHVVVAQPGTGTWNISTVDSGYGGYTLPGSGSPSGS
jgi:hypothetical protein